MTDAVADAVTGTKAAAGGRRGNGARLDLRVVAGLVMPGTRVLDVGCGDGALLELLVREKRVDGRGIELSQAGVHASVARGLSVIQGDADTDLADFPDGAFDHVILSQTLQAVRRPREVLLHMLRIGGQAIVSFPNFGTWRARLFLLGQGRMPTGRLLGEAWHATPSIHPCSIADFLDLCRELGVAIEHGVALGRDGAESPIGDGRRANLFAELAIFALRRA
jgi:methionine biosynthesis protein MetW